MVFPKNMRMIFKTISVLVAGIFLWNQIAFAGDLINTALDQQYKDQSQTFAPGYLQNQQSAAESIVSQKQAIEDTVNTQALTASADIPASADETIDLKGPVGGPSSQPAAKTAVTGETDLDNLTPPVKPPPSPAPPPVAVSEAKELLPPLLPAAPPAPIVTV